MIREEVDGMQIRRLKKGRLFFDFEELLHTLNESDVDMINWLSGPLSSTYFRKYQRSLKKPIVWTVYKGPISLSELRNLSPRELALLHQFHGNIQYSLMPKFLIRRGGNIPQIKFIITWTERLKRYFLRLGVQREKTVVIPSGVDTEVFRQRSEREISLFKENLGFTADDEIMLYFGLPSTFRGIDIVLATFRRLKEVRPKAKLVLLFREPRRDVSKEVSDVPHEEAEHGDSVIIERGIQTQENLAKFLSIANLVVLPFKFWPHVDCPLTVLEAMAVGRPVITTNVGSLPEFVQDHETGVIAKPNPEAVFDAALELLSSEALSEKIGKKASDHIQKNYSWDLIVKRTLETFEKGLD
jgi:glycosyltransferase involved in cell wall biosynthesis